MFLKILTNIQHQIKHKPISTSNIKISSHRLSLFYQTRQHIHIAASNCHSHSWSRQPRFYHLRIFKPTHNNSPYIYIYILSNCTQISFQFNLSSQTPPPRGCIHQFLAPYQHRSRHKHGSTRYTSARMQHTFTPVCIVKPVFSLVTGHASLL